MSKLLGNSLPPYPIKEDKIMSFWQEYDSIHGDLEDVKRMIIENTRNKYLGEVIEPMVYSSGKMLRPAFVLLSGSFGNENGEKLKRLAMVIEILHMATLIHDDIIDDADMRRGEPSIQSMKGKNAAVYVGDYYLCQCFLILSQEYEVEDLREIAKVMNTICLAEVLQNYNKRNEDMTVRNYLKIISGKTADLFALSFLMGAKSTGCKKDLIYKLGKIGHSIGMAFQIIDDILDYSSDTLVLGKENNKDIKQGYFTLPLIYALKKDKSNRLKNTLDKYQLEYEDYASIVQAVKDLGGIEYSRQLAKKYGDKAFKLIKELPDCESKRILFEVTEKLFRREY